MKKILEVSNVTKRFGGLAANEDVTFDVYEGEHVQEGFKSVAFRVRMQDANATMTDDVIEAQMANLRATLKKSLPDLMLRGE